MRIDIITVLPEMLEGFVNESILARAQKKGLAEIHLHNLRDYTTDKWRRVDDYPYGGFAGMVMQCEPIDRAISALKAERNYDEVIFTSPDGEQFNQHVANDLSMLENIIILCGHYKGIDQRVRDHLITREISIGDYVLTGGELAGGHGRRHRARGAGGDRRRAERPVRLFPRRYALCTHLHTAGRLQGMEGARHFVERKRGQDKGMGDGPGNGTDTPPAPRPSQIKPAQHGDSIRKENLKTALPMWAKGLATTAKARIKTKALTKTILT